MTTEAQPAANAQADGQSPVTPPAGVQNAENASQEQTIPYARFKEINDKLKALEEDAAKQAAARQAEDERKLTEQQEWQKLADSRKAKVDELAPKAELADKLTALVTEQYQSEIKDWPAQVKVMAPGDDASILTKLEWLGKAKPLAAELMADAAPTPGNGRRPRPSGPAGSKPTRIEPIYDVKRNF